MSIDDQIEQKAYDAVARLQTIPRPKEVRRMCLNVIALAAKIGGYEFHYEDDNAGQPPKSP